MQILDEELVVRDLIPITRPLVDADLREMTNTAGYFRLERVENAWQFTFDDGEHTICWTSPAGPKATQSLEKFYWELAKADMEVRETLVDVLDRDGNELTIFRHEAIPSLNGYKLTETMDIASRNDPDKMDSASIWEVTVFRIMSNAALGEFWKERNDAIWAAIDRSPHIDMPEPTAISWSDSPAPRPGM